jgi:hypothetical protein
MAHNSGENERAAAQPPWASPIPERFEYEAPWTVAAPDGVEVEVQLWADRSAREAQVRVLGGALLGTVDASVTGPIEIDADPDAVAQYGEDWVETQLLYARDLMARRVGRW